MRDHAGVGVERGRGDQGQEVTALLGVDQEDPLPRFEESRHATQASSEAEAVSPAGAERSRTEINTCSPGAIFTRGDQATIVPEGAAQDEDAPGDDEPGPVAIGHAAPEGGAEEAPEEEIHGRPTAAGSRRRPSGSGPAGARPGRPG